MILGPVAVAFLFFWGVRRMVRRSIVARIGVCAILIGGVHQAFNPPLPTTQEQLQQRADAKWAVTLAEIRSHQ
jgi:hypothetical protein